MTPHRSIGDYVQPFQVEPAGLRGRLVRLGPALKSALRTNRYPPAVAAILAESLALTAVLASGLKYQGVFSLQLQGDGPVGLVVADLTSSGDLRAYARFDAERLHAAGARTGGTVPRLIGAGHLAFTVDQGPTMERYQGITALEGATLADCAHLYFRQSEQLETVITLSASNMATGNGGRRAAALMLQRLPPQNTEDDESAEEDWRRAGASLGSVTPDELLNPHLEPADLLYRLLPEGGVRVFRPRALRYRCRCSRAKVEGTLQAFPRNEVEALAENGVVQVRCEFCGAEYEFLGGDLATLCFR
jgi:molecular chaperone Hsp33